MEMHFTTRLFVRLCCLVGTTLSLASASAGTVSLMDRSGLRLQDLPTSVNYDLGLVTIISSPGTPSVISSRRQQENDEDEALVLETNDDSLPKLYCRGATLQGTSDATRTSLATCSLVSTAIVLDGITQGDVQAGLQHSRHARTLTALFRARVQLGTDDGSKQTLLLGMVGEDATSNDTTLPQVTKAVQSLYEAAAVETKGAKSFEELYNLQIVSVSTPETAEQALSLAAQASKEFPRDSQASFLEAMSNAHSKVKESGVGAVALDPPHIAQAFLSIGHVFHKQSRTVRARVAAWKSRVARGLWVDGFGKDAEGLRKKVLGTFDGETLSAAGLPLVAQYRLEMRSKLQSMVDTAIEELFAAQVSNLEKLTLKRFQNQLLKTINEPAESLIDSNAATLRKEFLNFENVVGDLQVPALGLTKERAARDMSSKLNDALLAFPDSPAAKIKRTQKVAKVVNRERKPTQRAFDIGLDLVAVLRPDGFGSLQGFAGYQYKGNSLTFGIHNDADDPQVIAQFGGVRPPLLRVQPKLRVDVEL